MSAPPSEASGEQYGEDYEVVSFRVSWAGLSIFLFLLTLSGRYLLELQPWRPDPIWLWSRVVPVILLGLSSLGFLAGWIGWKTSKRRGMAKLGMFLNGVVATIILLVGAAFFYILVVR